MPKSRLLLLDANIVIELHKLSLWSALLEKFEVSLTGKVLAEVQHWPEVDELAFDPSHREIRNVIDLTKDINSGELNVIDVPLSIVADFANRFDPTYEREIHGGERESLAFLCATNTPWLISSSDRVVFRVLGRLQRGEQGISLEELLQSIGRSPGKLARKLSKNFREEFTKRGQEDFVTGRGLKDKG